MFCRRDIDVKKIWCFLVLPIIFVAARIWTAADLSQLISFGLFVAASFLVSLLLYFLLCKIDFTLKKTIFMIAFLALTDQLLKLVIYKNKFGANLIGPLLRIEMTKNVNQTAMFNYFDLEFDTLVVIIFKIVTFLVLCCIFAGLKNKSANIVQMFILLLSADISNIADSVIWGYTLDYVYFYKLTCYDLKDFYVDTAIGILLMEIFCKYKSKREISEKTLDVK